VLVIVHTNYISWSIRHGCCGIFAAVIFEQVYSDCTTVWHSLQLPAAGEYTEGLWAVSFHCCLDRARWYKNAISYSFLYIDIVIVDRDYVFVFFLLSMFSCWSYSCTVCMHNFEFYDVKPAKMTCMLWLSAAREWHSLADIADSHSLHDTGVVLFS